MPTRKLSDDTRAVKVCRHSDHAPHSQQMFEPGLWEHECPGCGVKTVFRVERTALTSALPARRCERCHGNGWYDSGYNGWFAAPDTKCECCNGTGVVQ